MQATTALIAELRRSYPSLAALPIDELRRDLAHGGQLLEAAAGTRLFSQGEPCQGFPLVLAGEIAVTRGSNDGRTLELYRVVRGEVCVVSAACLLGHEPLTALGTTVSDTRLLLLTPEIFDRWTEQASFRAFVFAVFAERLAELMAVVDAVAFQRLDRRLADYLLGHGQYVLATHQAIADELGTVREIVTRLLNRFEHAGLVRLGRERIEILEAEQLRSLCNPGH